MKGCRRETKCTHLSGSFAVVAHAVDAKIPHDALSAIAAERVTILVEATTIDVDEVGPVRKLAN